MMKWMIARVDETNIYKAKKKKKNAYVLMAGDYHKEPLMEGQKFMSYRVILIMRAIQKASIVLKDYQDCQISGITIEHLDTNQWSAKYA